MFLSAFLCLSVFLFICIYSNSKDNEQIPLKCYILVGPDQTKGCFNFGKETDYIPYTKKKILNFQRFHFLMYFQ